ncbi:Pentatricopeptide repeat [Trema orientale]|uniref:Pentatricopeptide repeat n=1 Tax=Trema orientale TaxID=63057 RepID=A0A2P5F034_TREOI|nr:Pentatricopeptide repeat [Trema orientale]
MGIVSLFASKQSNRLFHLLQPRSSNPFSLSILRHLSLESNSHHDHETSINQVIELLQAPENDWDLDQLRRLLYSDSEISSSKRFFHIARRLGSSAKALKFLDYVRENSECPEDSPLLSYVFQAVLEVASREPSWGKRVFDLYTASRERNVPLTFNAATLLFGCLGRAGMREELLLVSKELDPDSKNTHVCNRLIDVLFNLGNVDEALHVLEEMLEPNAKFPPNDVTGEIVFSRILRRDRPGRRFKDEEIVGLLSKFGDHGVFPDTLRLTQLITNFCRDGKIDHAWDVLNDAMKSGGSVLVASCNALLTGLGRSSDFKRMNELMAKMKERDIKPDVVTFSILINRLCKSRRVDDALEVFEKMRGGVGAERGKYSVEPDVVTYNTLIDGLCKVGRQEEGLKLMEQMRSQKCSAPNAVTYNCLIDGFNKVGEIDKAMELFDQMKEKKVPLSVITLNTLVDGLCRHGRISSAVKLFDEMQRDGIKGNVVTYSTLITAFCNVNNINKAMELFERMLSSGSSTDAIIYYSLISGLSQAGRMDDASMVVSKLKEAGFGMDIISYNVLISRFCKKNKLDKAYEMLKEMEEAEIKPDTATYNILISHLSKTGSLGTAHRVLRKMLSEGLVPTVVTYGTLIHGYCLTDNIKEAMKLFRKMTFVSKVPPNTVIYNILIDALCKGNEVQKALSLMDDMKAQGVKPNTTTYNALFKGLREKNLLEKAFKFMDRMVEQACHPDYITMEILTEWLSAAGKIDKLRKFIQGYEVSVPEKGKRL